ncbi:MAG: enoyl-CoA hydratase/isomerase family protein [Alphaproteobacteria bacterium]
MSDDTLLTNRNGRVLELTLNRPDALNSFNDALYKKVGDALNAAAQDDSIACVLITGAGRAFSAGQALDELGDGRTHEQRQQDGFRPFIEAVESFPKPLIAAVNGLGVGIGFTILLHCDAVFMGESGRLRVPFVSLGLTAEAGSSQLLVDRIGWQKTADLLYRNLWMSADAAVADGIALAKVADADLLETARTHAAEIAAMPIASLMATKQLLLDARLDATRAARIREDVAFDALVDGPANKEALAAFAEKRAADFINL